MDSVSVMDTGPRVPSFGEERVGHWGRPGGTGRVRKEPRKMFTILRGTVLLDSF